MTQEIPRIYTLPPRKERQRPVRFFITWCNPAHACPSPSNLCPIHHYSYFQLNSRPHPNPYPCPPHPFLSLAPTPTSKPSPATLAPLSPAFFVLLALAIYTGVTVSFLGRRFGDWRFSWSYIVGWVALLMTFFAGTSGACGWEGQRQWQSGQHYRGQDDGVSPTGRALSRKADSREMGSGGVGIGVGAGAGKAFEGGNPLGSLVL